MLSLLIAHSILTICCLVSGWAFYKLFQVKNEERSIIFYLVSGLIMFAAVIQILVLLFPINFVIQLSIVAILLLIVFFWWRDFKNFLKKIIIEFSSWPATTSFLLLIIWLVVVLIGAGPIIMDDTESYHIQSIKWIQEYGSVPGLVNLHERFGFNSSWFSSVALFSFSNDTSGGFTVLNGILSMWLCYWCISKYNQFQKENNSQASLSILIILIACFIVWPLTRGNAATTNYDFISTCIVLILFTEIYFSGGKGVFPSLESIIWPVYLFTVRIINFPLLLISLFGLIVIARQKNFKLILLPIAYCLLLIVPFIIRNIIITGYPFYPATNFGWANVDWKPDPLMTERLLEYIKYYNRVSTTYLEIEQTKALGTNWVPSWFKYMFSFDKVLVISGLIGIVLSLIKLFIKRNKNTALLISISITWLILWFLISPDPRFVYGILLFGVFLLAYCIISLIKNIQILKSVASILVMLMIAGSVYYSISKLWKQKEYRNWIKPAQLPQPPVKEFVIEGMTFRIPELINNNWNARCYGTELPCLYKIDPRLKPRGKVIRNGFRLEK